MPAKTGHGPHSFKIVVFYVLFVLYRAMYCLCVNVYCTVLYCTVLYCIALYCIVGNVLLPPGDNQIAVNKYHTNSVICLRRSNNFIKNMGIIKAPGPVEEALPL